MSDLFSTGIGEEGEAAPLEIPGLWVRARKLAGKKLSYALADQIVFSFGNMVVAALLSRHAPQWEFGIYILTQRALDVFIQLCNVFFWAPFVYNLPQMPRERGSQYLGSILLHQLLACVLTGVVCLGFRAWAHTSSRGIYYGVFAPLLLTSGSIVFREFNRRMYFAQMRFRTAFWMDVVTNGLQIAGVAWLWHVRQLTVSNTLRVLALGCLFVSLYWLVSEWRSFTVSLRAAYDDLKLNMRLGRWFFGSNMIFTISSQANPWVLGAMLGGASVGAYAVCEGVTNIPRVALTSMQNIMAPMMARDYAKGGKQSLGKLVFRIDKILLLSSIAFAIVLIIFGPWLARLIFKVVPDNSRTILVLLSLNLVAFASTLARTYGLTAIDRAGLTFYANSIGLAVQIAVCVWFVRWLHVPGAAAAVLVGTVVVAIARVVYFRREMQTV